MSSPIARASRNARSCGGQAGPTSAKTPSRKAVSVEITTPQADTASFPRLNATYTSAGVTSPASAASAGTAARRRSASSPMASSRLTSSPTT
jgi:hypothetical protein